jgi:hypothetical protein
LALGPTALVVLPGLVYSHHVSSGKLALLVSPNVTAQHEENVSLKIFSPGTPQKDIFTAIKQCPLGSPWLSSARIYTNPSTLISIDCVELKIESVQMVPRLIEGAPTDFHSDYLRYHSDLRELSIRSYRQMSFRNRYLQANKHGYFVSRHYNVVNRGTIIISKNYNIFRSIENRIIPHPEKAIYLIETMTRAYSQLQAGRFCLVRGEEASNDELKNYQATAIKRIVGRYNQPVPMLTSILKGEAFYLKKNKTLLFFLKKRKKN